MTLLGVVLGAFLVLWLVVFLVIRFMPIGEADPAPLWSWDTLALLFWPLIIIYVLITLALRKGRRPRWEKHQ